MPRGKGARPGLPPARDLLAGLPSPSFLSRVDPRCRALHLWTVGSSTGRAGRRPPALLWLLCARSACFPRAGGWAWVPGQLLTCGVWGGALSVTSSCTCARVVSLGVCMRPLPAQPRCRAAEGGSWSLLLNLGTQPRVATGTAGTVLHVFSWDPVVVREPTGCPRESRVRRPFSCVCCAPAPPAGTAVCWAIGQCVSRGLPSWLCPSG